MEHKGRANGAIFQQVCKVNDLDPKEIEVAVAKKSPGKEGEDEKEELLIWAALDHKARVLLQDVATGGSIGKDSELAGKLYTIDGDPAAPAFIINEERIRSTYTQDQANKLIDALGQVRLPIRA